MYTIYHNPRCSKSRQTLDILTKKHLNFTIVHYLEVAWSKKALVDIFKQLAQSPSECIRTTESIYSELDLKHKSEEHILDAIIAHPILLQRPIVTTPKGARICRPPEKVLDIL